MPLTDVTIKTSKLNEKPYKIYDEKGLYVLINRSGKYFRFDFRINGKRKTLALGIYPDVSLKDAREKRDDARKLVAKDIDPCELKRVEKRAKFVRATNSFEAIAREWVSKQSGTWTASHQEKVLCRLENDVFPVVGGKPVAEITAFDLLALLRKIENRGAIDTAHRAKQNCSQVFRYAIATGRAERDPAADLRGALHSIKKNHYPTITEPKKIAELLRAIDGYSGSIIVKFSLQLAPLLFVRPGELRNAEWSEFDLDRCEWRIPASKMKMRIEHLVPLSEQAIKIINELHNYTGYGKYLFPSVRTGSRPMSSNTVNAALRRLGYTQTEMTGHGFRAMASTSLHEQGWSSDIIERQLAHGERNPVKAAYNHAEYLPERRKMMQFWANYLDDLKAGGKIIPFMATAT
jgi:integrase